MKKITFAVVSSALALGVSLPGFAQTSKFEGLSANVGLGYQSIKPKFDNVTDNNTPTGSYTSTTSTGSGLIGKVGVEYTWALTSKYVVSAGLDYGLNYGKNSDVEIYRATTGAFVGSDRTKVKQNAGISISPGMLIDNTTLAYIKLGYTATTSKAESDGATESGNAYVLGLGAKFLQANDYFVYTGLDYLAGKKKTITGQLNGDSKGSGYTLTAGIGKRF